jgi:hypothetical protein
VRESITVKDLVALENKIDSNDNNVNIIPDDDIKLKLNKINS